MQLQHPDDGPVVIGANWYRFRASEQIQHLRVMSVCFLWVVDGGGHIRCGSRSFRMDRGSLLRLPWAHRVRYDADALNPFHLGTLHVVPRHAGTDPVVPRVAHRPGDPQLDDPARSVDSRISLHHDSAHSGAGARLVHLGSYAIERWLAGPFEEDLFRALARVVLAESAAWAAEGVAPSPVPALATMMQFVRTNLDLQLDVAQIAASADCSPTTAQRHFRAGTGGSVQRWVRRTKMTEAALLLRSSGLRVNEVATLLGYPDALHFSRLFAQTFGVAPSRYAAGQMRP